MNPAEAFEPVPDFLRPMMRSPRAAALYCAQNMSAAFGPPVWPCREPFNRRLLSSAPEEQQRASWRYDAACRIRGLLWARVQLAKEIAADPSDKESIDLLAALERYSFTCWGIEMVPPGYDERDHIARDFSATFAAKKIWEPHYQRIEEKDEAKKWRR